MLYSLQIAFSIQFVAGTVSTAGICPFARTNEHMLEPPTGVGFLDYSRWRDLAAAPDLWCTTTSILWVLE